MKRMTVKITAYLRDEDGKKIVVVRDHNEDFPYDEEIYRALMKALGYDLETATIKG